MKLVIDSGVLGKLCHPNSKANRPLVDWLRNLLEHYADRLEVCVPQIADYELRRKLLHLIAKSQATLISIQRLDQFISQSEFLALDVPTMHLAAQLWADARLQGQPTAAEAALDGDVILAAQAIQVGGVVLTDNTKHLRRFADARTWRDLGSDPKELISTS